MIGKTVGIELNEKRYTLRYDMNALSEIERELGISIAELPDQKATFRTMLVIFWAGLLHAQPNLTVRQAGNLIRTTDDFNTVAVKCGEALFTAFGKAEGNGADPFPDGTGTE